RVGAVDLPPPPKDEDRIGQEIEKQPRFRLAHFRFAQHMSQNAAILLHRQQQIVDREQSTARAVRRLDIERRHRCRLLHPFGKPSKLPPDPQIYEKRRESNRAQQRRIFKAGYAVPKRGQQQQQRKRSRRQQEEQEKAPEIAGIRGHFTSLNDEKAAGRCGRPPLLPPLSYAPVTTDSVSPISRLSTSVA